MSETREDLDLSKHQEPDYRSLLERELELAGIPTAVVDPHHHVVPFWYHHLEGKQPAHLLHIDAHDDMFRDGIPNSRIRRRELMVSYTKYHLGINTFIWAADYFGLLDSIYHFDPRKKPVACFKDDEHEIRARALVRSDENGWLCGIRPENSLVPRPLPKPFSRENVRNRLNNSEAPLIVDIDLDALECIGRGEPCEPNLPRRTYYSRLASMLEFLSTIRNPTLITLARSMHPEIYVPMDRVSDIEKDVIEGLERIYHMQVTRSAELPVYPCASNGQLSLPL
ncbi:TPA: hypothetical protein HA249_01095 [Candidatus Woesearchaeota archaeon]|nr:hypothetical protein [Candidatus Woesearchaeota archaeon]HIH47235.1 hypothetical protein [Candidatus Woesearchaeota archaeon]HII88066.1 hypothetical protein [Candidatus Woesearchaeota archaeon]